MLFGLQGKRLFHENTLSPNPNPASSRPDVDLSQYDTEEDTGDDKEEDKEEECAIEDEGVDIVKERIEAILLRSKERQANFRGGKARQFEEILAESSLERKDHWRQIKNSVY